LSLAIVNVGVLEWARRFVGEFWEEKARIPGVTGYNDAQRVTQEVRLNMVYLAASWGVVGVLGLLI